MNPKKVELAPNVKAPEVADALAGFLDAATALSKLIRGNAAQKLDEATVPLTALFSDDGYVLASLNDGTFHVTPPFEMPEPVLADGPDGPINLGLDYDPLHVERRS